MLAVFVKTLNLKYHKKLTNDSAGYAKQITKQFSKVNDSTQLHQNAVYNYLPLKNSHLNPLPTFHMSDQLLNLAFQKYLNSSEIQTEICHTKQQKTQLIQPQQIYQLSLNNVQSIQFQANQPSEDRLLTTELKSIKALCLNIFDGHGGYNLSEYCFKKIAGLIDGFINQKTKQSNNQNQIVNIIKESIIRAYQRIEQDFYETLEDILKSGNKNLAMVGTCALSVVIHLNNIVIANCGDSQSLIITEDDKGLFFIKGNEQLSVNNVSQIQRIEQKFKGKDDQVFVKTKQNKIYLKGILQPTKTIGDYYLKHQKLFNRVTGEIGKYKGPYLDCVPQFKIFKIEPNYKYMIIASDGLWDFVTKKEVLQIIKKQQAKTNAESQAYTIQDLNKTYIEKFQKPYKLNLAEALKNFVLQKCAKNKGITVQKLQSIEGGQKRKYCDDLSIIVVNFKDNSQC